MNTGVDGRKIETLVRPLKYLGIGIVYKCAGECWIVAQQFAVFGYWIFACRRLQRDIIPVIRGRETDHGSSLESRDEDMLRSRGTWSFPFQS